MTPTELKELAEWSAEFLGAELGCFRKWPDTYTLIWEGGSINFEAEDVFNSPHHAPILMHIGQEEMEKRWFEIVHFTWGGHTKYGCRVNGSEKHGHEPHTAYDDNKFIAFWLAVRDALK